MRAKGGRGGRWVMRGQVCWRNWRFCDVKKHSVRHSIPLSYHPVIGSHSWFHYFHSLVIFYSLSYFLSSSYTNARLTAPCIGSWRFAPSLKSARLFILPFSLILPFQLCLLSASCLTRCSLISGVLDFDETGDRGTMAPSVQFWLANILDFNTDIDGKNLLFFKSILDRNSRNLQRYSLFLLSLLSIDRVWQNTSYPKKCE